MRLKNRTIFAGRSNNAIPIILITMYSVNKNGTSEMVVPFVIRWVE